MKPALLALLLSLPLAACLQHYVAGGVNDVTYHMSLDRGPVPGAEEADMGIQVVMDGPHGLSGTLWVDGVCFGPVVSGDHVEVTDDAAVLVNDEVREPVGS